MTGLLGLLILFLGWLGYAFYQAARQLFAGKKVAEGAVCVLMANQAGVAEWFLRKLCRNNGVQQRQIDLAVYTEGTTDDTSRIVKILSRQKGFNMMESCDSPELTGCCKKYFITLDVRNINNTFLLEQKLRSIL